MDATVSGPVSGGAHGWPFAAAGVDLAAHGYVEQEWIVEGEAERFRPVGEVGGDGRWTVEPASSAPFVTRALVRRPLDPTRFNGTVVVEWNNVSAGCEIAEAGEGAVIFEDGFAWVGISAQHVGVHGFAPGGNGLVDWDPDRYGTLHVDDDALSYSVFATVTRAIAGPERSSDPDPLDGLVVDRRLAIGGSQSASRLVSYINACHLRDRLFDGYIPFTWFGSGSSIDDPAVLDPADPQSVARMVRHVTRIRDDLGVPVLVVNSECETGSCFGVRQADTGSFRFWEVAGSPHGPRLHMERILPKLEREGVSLTGGVTISASALSPVPWAPVLDAGIAHMHRWMASGEPPPAQPLIDVDPGEPPRIRRDADGNATGGLRVPEMEVPLGRSVGAFEEAGMAGLMGTWAPFDASTILERYPTAQSFHAAFVAAADAAVGAGLMRPSDAVAAVSTADENYRALTAS